MEFNIDKIIRSKRRSISLVVTREAQLIVRAPIHVPLDFINNLISAKSLWIKKKMQEVSLLPKPLQTGILTKEEKKAIKEKIIERVEWFSKLTGIKYSKIKVTSARTRWGSCSAKGNLNFSCRLGFVPSEILDYVVVHELSHIREMNHSRKFWNRVALVIPDYKDRRKWLRKNG